ncbi:MAG: DUF928 domain-containing protein [Nostoc sp. S13]|nr:DUF928 domain-containing protein [Nostoc sp. S13]
MKLILALALFLSSTILYSPAKVIAQIKQPTTSGQPTQATKKRPVFVWAKKPSRLSNISGRRVGMGSRNGRDDCLVVETPLIALVPFKERNLVNKQLNKSTPIDVWGLTTEEHPTFWFYVPYIKNFANLSAEFVLQDQEENDVYRHAIALRTTPGVIDVPLPSTVAPLQVGKIYRWYFKVYCYQQDQTIPPTYVEGDIQRVILSSSEESQLAATDPREKIAIYAALGIWYDSLTILAQIYKANPQDTSLAADWQSLLQSINLGNIATAPLVN